MCPKRQNECTANFESLSAIPALAHLKGASPRAGVLAGRTRRCLRKLRELPKLSAGPETANRFARDLMVPEVGFAMLRELGVALIAADSSGGRARLV